MNRRTTVAAAIVEWWPLFTILHVYCLSYTRCRQEEGVMKGRWPSTPWPRIYISNLIPIRLLICDEDQK